jgi:hypothetical protein
MYLTLVQGATEAQDVISATVYKNDGTKITPVEVDGFLVHNIGEVEDTNGNLWQGNSYLISQNSQSAPIGLGVPPTDTLGRQPLTITVPGTNPPYYTPPSSYNILNSQNQRVSLPVTWALIHVQTNFQAPGITEANFDIEVIQKIALPDGSAYQFKYDCDSTTSSACSSPTGQTAYYGLPTSVTFPTSGVMNFTYSNFTDANGNINRWVTGRSDSGNWTFTPAVNCGTSCQTVTVTKPSGDQAVYTFTLSQGNGAWNTNAKYYTGSATGTPLMTVQTLYSSYATSLFLGSFAFTHPTTTTS